jgi:outer membrane immunogenic protein
MIKVLCVASAVAISGANVAMAADLPTHKAPPAYTAPYASLPYSWTGFYFGVNGGFGIGNSGGFGEPSGGLVGGTVGYNYQIGQFVIGAEGDWDFADLNHGAANSLANYQIRQDDIVTARGRLGYALDRTLLYVTGGYAGVHEHASYYDPITGFNGSQSHWRDGGVIGGGVEYAFTNNISAKAEYLYLPTGSNGYFGSTPYETRGPSGDSLFRVGLNYKF